MSGGVMDERHWITSRTQSAPDDVIELLLDPPQRLLIVAASWHLDVPFGLRNAVDDDRAGTVILQRGDVVDVIVHADGESIALSDHWSGYFLEAWCDQILDDYDPSDPTWSRYPKEQEDE